MFLSTKKVIIRALTELSVFTRVEQARWIPINLNLFLNLDHAFSLHKGEKRSNSRVKARENEISKDSTERYTGGEKERQKERTTNRYK